MSRDNFSKPTIGVLAKRVGFLCSNPDCRRLTIGPNEIENRATTIGIAAHITAAAANGPRYDEGLKPEERSHIDNGIWLCSNCAALIDKDELKYAPELLRQWKRDAEAETTKKLNGEIPNVLTGAPFLEVDLIPASRSRGPMGYSPKNPSIIEKGRRVMVLPDKPIHIWELAWRFRLVLYNNSEFPAYNLRIESVGLQNFDELSSLPRINNLAPLDNIDLIARVKDATEGTGDDATRVLQDGPQKLKDVILRISYYDRTRRHEHVSEVSFSGFEANTKKIK